MKISPEVIESLRERIAGRRAYRSNMTYADAKPGNDTQRRSACKVTCDVLEQLLDTYEKKMTCTCPHQDATEPDHDSACPAKERIVAAAIHHAGISFSVPPPQRHHNVAQLMFGLGLPTDAQRYQGFLTNRGRFVDRFEAAKIARAAQQVGSQKRTDPQGELFSEDLW